MQISLNWLKELVAIEVDADELARRLTMLGLEIEAQREPGKDIADIYVGVIRDIQPHPDADKLVVCQTDVGRDAPLQIVCGATNMKPGDKVPTAVDGATLPGGFAIGRRKMRGIESCGMMCSARELNLGDDHAGLMILDPDTPVGEDIRKTLGLDDVIYEIEVTPNRGDWASMIGVARELAAFYSLELRVPEITLQESGEPAASTSSVIIEAPELCPRYAARILRKVTIKPSPPWLCARLLAAGQRPINNVVDVTNFVLLETGHPLHSFDLNKLAEKRIVVRRARPGETITTLDGEPRALEPDMLVIADAARPQAVAGVMGGADSEVDDNTTDILLENAYFTPRSIRATARKLGLVTEAAQHFQRGADENMAIYALNRAAMLIQALADAEIAPGIIDTYPAPRVPAPVTLRFERTRQLLGADIPHDTQVTILESLGFPARERSEDKCVFSVPLWRHDVSHESDLIEEVARLYGYDNIPATMPPVRQTDKVFAPGDSIVRALRRFLAAQGLTEVMNWSFGSPQSEARAGVADVERNMVMLSNPLSENYAGMRTSLLPALYGVAAYNHKRGAKSIAAFELGPVYRNVADEQLPEEPTYLGVILGGSVSGHWSRPERAVDFYDIKGIVDAIGRFFGRSLTLEACESDAFSPDNGALIKLRKTTLGQVGHPARSVTKAFDLPETVFIMELNLEPLLAHPLAPPQFQEIPQFPASLRDLAVVVDVTVNAETIMKCVKEGGGALLKTVEVFDVYRGNPLPPDRKSVALSLVFQSPERTLTDKDTEKSMERIVKRLRDQCGAELR